MRLLPNETTITSINDDLVILTNYRIQFQDYRRSQSIKTSIFLEDISSLEVKYRSHIIFIILSVITILSGTFLTAAGENLIPAIAGIILGGIFILLWRFTRKHIISISSKGGAAIVITVQGIDENTIEDFIHNVSMAKFSRINQIHFG